MCRWLAYTGSPILLTDVLYTPAHSLIDQSLHSRLGAEATNGDGFGIGWYDATPTPGVFKSIEPAWNDQNLRDLAVAVNPSLYPEISGGTDSELLFFLALTFGLEENPPDAVAQAIGFVEA